MRPPIEAMPISFRGLLKHPRRFLRISLRTLLIVTTLAGAWLGYEINLARRQKESVAAVRRLGGWVYYDYQLNGEKYDPTGQSPVPNFLRGWLDEDLVSTVVHVNLVYNDVGPRLDNQQTTDEGLRHLGGFPKLTHLLLKDTQASDEGLKEVAKLKHLEALYMWDASAVSDRGVAHLARLSKLESLHLSNSKVTDDSLRVLGRLPTLTRLSLQGNRFTDRGLAHLKNLRRLEHLWVGLPEERPDGGQTAITDAGLSSLEHLPKLTTLDVQRSKVTPDGLARLQRLKPKLKIYH